MNDRSIVNLDKMSFIASDRRGIEKAALIMLFTSIVLVIFILVNFYQFSTLANQIKSQKAVLSKYSLLTSKLESLEKEESQLSTFHKQVSRLSQIRTADLDVRSLFTLLEEARLPDVVFVKIEYQARAGKSIIEIESENGTAIGDMMRSLENQPLFKSVSILKKERSDSANTTDKYTVEIKF